VIRTLTLNYFSIKKYVARIVEGCNATSVIILFIIICNCFSGKLKLLFFYYGSLLIYVLNVMRIAALECAYFLFSKKRAISARSSALYIYGVVLFFG
jgi:hypothetical protein